MSHQQTKQAKLYNQVSNESEDETDEYEIQYKTEKRSRLTVIMRNPSFILFTLCLILSIFSILYLFIGDIHINFVFCGGIGLIIFIFGLYKFRILLAFKNELKFYQNSIRKLKIENGQIKGAINRSKEAIKILKDTKNRIKNINLTNKNNIFCGFQEIEKKMENAGIENNLYNKAVTIRKIWTAEYLKNEQETKKQIYNRFISQDLEIDNDGIAIPKKIKSKKSKQKKVRFKPEVQVTKYSPSQEFNDLDIVQNNHNNHNNHDGNKHNHDNYDHNDNQQDTDNLHHNDDSDDNADNADNADNDDNDESVVLISEVTDSSQSRSQSPFIKVQESNDYDEKDDDDDEDIDDIDDIDDNIDDNIDDDDDDIDDDDIDDNDDEDDDNDDDDDDEEEMYKKKRRKIGKLQNKWNVDQTESEKGKYSSKSKVIKQDSSWIQQQKQSSIHPVHESVDALEINKLVSKSQIYDILSPVDEDDNDDVINKPNKFSFEDEDESKQKQKIGKLKRIKTKESENESNLSSPKGQIVNEDTSWIKHKKDSSIHPVHESVDALEINRLVSEAQIHRILTPVGEDEEEQVNQPTFTKKKSKSKTNIKNVSNQ